MILGRGVMKTDHNKLFSMRLKVLGSTSKGNCYILENKNEALIIEAGVTISMVRKALDGNIEKVVGCLISHSHNDHAGHMMMYAKAGISILSSFSVFNTRRINKLRNKGILIEPGQGYFIGSFNVIPFELNHDVPCLGFLITHQETGRIAFITDTFKYRHTFRDIDHYLIECNYANDILDKNVSLGVIHPSLRKRIIVSHMELENCKAALMANDLDKARQIILLHLSDNNSCRVRFREEVSAVTGKDVFIAAKGAEICMLRAPA
jgi:phosphoribosyl 1,2-cyclic phosphodiesterase